MALDRYLADRDVVELCLQVLGSRARIARRKATPLPLHLLAEAMDDSPRLGGRWEPPSPEVDHAVCFAVGRVVE
jgi:hypothetical protein